MGTRVPYLSQRLAGAVLGFVLAIAPAAHAQSDNLGELARIMSAKSTSVKERIAAATAMSRLADPAAVKPLVAALGDQSPTVRAIAAASLGKLGDGSAVTALRHLAERDPDPLVRRQAEAAIKTLSGAVNWAGLGATPAAARTAGFGSQPRAIRPRPDIYVVVKASADDGAKPHKKSNSHADLAREVLIGELGRTPSVTCAAADAGRFGLDPQNVDLTVTKLEQRVADGFVEVEAHLRLAISDGDGRMKSFLSGGAKVQVPRRTFDPKYLPKIRKEAVEGAVRGIFDKLIAQLRRSIA